MLSNFFKKLSKLGSSQGRQPGRSSFRPEFMALEDRLVMSTATISIGTGLRMVEGDSYKIPVYRTGDLTKEQKVSYAFKDGTAIYNSDYVRPSSSKTTGTLTFAKGKDVEYLNAVYAVDDTTDEDVQTFTVELSRVTGATYTLGNSKMTARIIDNDPPPNVASNNISKNVSESVNVLGITVSLGQKSEKVVEVKYWVADTLNYGATWNKDYFFSKHPGSSSGTLVFQPGETTKAISVGIREDKIVEWPENLMIYFQGPNHADIHYAAVTIKDNDVPTVRIEDATPVYEGNGTGVKAKFKVSIVEETERSVEVAYETVAGLGDAKADLDYISRAGSLWFMTGQRERTISIDIKGDITPESKAENFYVTIKQVGPLDPLRVERTMAKGTILDDDAAPDLTGPWKNGPGVVWTFSQIGPDRYRAVCEGDGVHTTPGPNIWVVSQVVDSSGFRYFIATGTSEKFGSSVGSARIDLDPVTGRAIKLQTGGLGLVRADLWMP